MISSTDGQDKGGHTQQEEHGATGHTGDTGTHGGGEHEHGHGHHRQDEVVEDHTHDKQGDSSEHAEGPHSA